MTPPQLVPRALLVIGATAAIGVSLTPAVAHADPPESVNVVLTPGACRDFALMYHGGAPYVFKAEDGYRTCTVTSFSGSVTVYSQRGNEPLTVTILP